MRLGQRDLELDVWSQYCARASLAPASLARDALLQITLRSIHAHQNCFWIMYRIRLGS